MEKRLYIVSKRGTLTGVFSNKKKLLEALETTGVENCYIDGERKKKKVQQSSLQTGFIQGYLAIYDFDTEEPVYKVWEIGMNHINTRSNDNKPFPDPDQTN